MKQTNFKMKTLCSETLKILINELNRPGSAQSNFSEKSYLYYTILTKVALLTATRILSDRNKKSSPNNFYRKILTIYLQKMLIKKLNFDNTDETEIKPPFYRSFSTF